MNYIKHLNKVMETFFDDERATSNHISIYLVLFKTANDNRFENPFPIYRPEVMKASKITSFSTYTRCLQQLHEWGYIKYKTSNNPKVGTLIELYDFSNSIDKSSSNSDSNSSSNTVSNSSGNSIGNTLPYIDNIKIIKVVKGNSPTFDEVVLFFLEQKFPEKEAQKFYNHFQSNGWKVGGKTPMQDWQAAARNWMLNAEKFNANDRDKQPGSRKSGAGNLHTGNDKNYSEPL